MILIQLTKDPLWKEETLRTSSGVQMSPGSIVPAGMGVSRVQTLPQSLGTECRGVQSLLESIAGDPLQIVQSGVLSIDNITPALKTQSLVTVLEDPPAEIISKTTPYVANYRGGLSNYEGTLEGKIAEAMGYTVWLDGVIVNGSILNGSVSCSLDSVHNSIELNCLGKGLFYKSSPFDAALKGTARITLYIGQRTLTFMLEERSGDETSFKLWGRSLSALEELPYSVPITTGYALDSPTLASEVAASLLNYRSLTWMATDWVVPTTFQFTGGPLDGVTTLANAIGAVVRSTDDGNLIVLPYYPVRPVFMQGSTPLVQYDRSALLRSLGYQEKRGEGYNAVEVSPFSSGDSPPQMELEETMDGGASPIQGQEVHVRVFWAGRKATDISAYVTDGEVEALEDDLSYEVTETLLEFREGKTSVQYPIDSLTDVIWIGDEGDNLDFVQNETELTIDDLEFRVATVRYKTKYSRYRIYNHDVAKLLHVLSYYSRPDEGILVKIDPGDVQAPSITNDLLTDDNAAIACGTAYLDKEYYNTKQFSISAPYQDDAQDGEIVSLEDGEIGCHGNFLILSSQISFEKNKVVNVMECLQCQV
jgi:hypothetical protein